MSYSISGIPTLEYATPNEFEKYVSSPVPLITEQDVIDGDPVPVVYYPFDILNQSSKLFVLKINIVKSYTTDRFALRVYPLNSAGTSFVKQYYYLALENAGEYSMVLSGAELLTGRLRAEILEFPDNATRDLILSNPDGYKQSFGDIRVTGTYGSVTIDVSDIDNIEATSIVENETYFYNLDVETLDFPEVQDTIDINGVTILEGLGNSVQVNIPTAETLSRYTTTINVTNAVDFAETGALKIEYPDGYYYKPIRATLNLDTFFQNVNFNNGAPSSEYNDDVDLLFNQEDNFIRVTPVLFYNERTADAAKDAGNLSGKQDNFSVYRKLEAKRFLFEVTDVLAAQQQLVSLESSTNIISEARNDRRSGGKSQVTFTLTSQGFPDGTVQPYTFSGIASNLIEFDVDDFQLYSNTATITASIIDDITVDSTLTVQAGTLSTTVFVLESDNYRRPSRIDPNEPDPNPDSVASPIGYGITTDLPLSVSSAIGTTNLSSYGIGAAALTSQTQNIAYDYSEHFNRAIEALDTIAINQSKIAGHTGQMAESLNSMDETLKVIKGDIKLIRENIARLRDLGDGERDGAGIRMTDKYRDVESAILWQLYIEQGGILNTNISDDYLQKVIDNDNVDIDPAIQSQIRARSLNRINAYLTSLRRNLGDGYGDN